MKDLNIREEMKKNIPKIEEESKYIISKLLEDIKKYNAYELLSKYMSFITTNDTLNPFDTSNDVELKFGLEAIQMLMTCINEKEFDNKEIDDNNFFEIVNNMAKLFSLEAQYSMSVSFDFADELEIEGEYIFENILTMNITGQRYTYFEKEHHKNTGNRRSGSGADPCRQLPVYGPSKGICGGAPVWPHCRYQKRTGSVLENALRPEHPAHQRRHHPL